MTNANSDVVPFQANYAQYHQKRGSSGYLWRAYDRRLAEIIPFARPGVKVLEIGCGIGADLHWVALKGAQATGIDVKSEWITASVALTDTVAKHFGLINVDIRRMNLLDMRDEQFDLIYMKDTFHHLEPRDDMVEKIAGLLRPGGTLVIVEPNAWNPIIQYQMFRIRGFNTIVDKTDKATGERFVYGNERLLFGSTMRRLFNRVGINGSTRTFRLLPTVLTNKAAFVRIADALERVGIDRWIAPGAIHCVYSGQKN